MWSVSALCETLNPDKTKIFHQKTTYSPKILSFRIAGELHAETRRLRFDTPKGSEARRDSATHEKRR